MYVNLPRIEQITDSNREMLRIAADGQPVIHVKRGHGKECLAVARMFKAGTPNRRRLIINELKVRNLLS